MCSAELLVTICHIFKLFSLLVWIRLSSYQILLYAEGCFQSLSFFSNSMGWTIKIGTYCGGRSIKYNSTLYCANFEDRKNH